MTVVDTTPTLIPPEPGWGAVLRKMRVDDFIPFMRFLGVAALLWGIGHLPPVKGHIHNGQSVSALIWIFAAIAALIAVFALWIKSGDRETELDVERATLRNEWEYNVLIPYLEAKYNVKFKDFWGAFADNAGGRVCILDDNRDAEVVINGLYAQYSLFDSLNIDYSIEDEVTLTEVVRPKPKPRQQTLYLPLEPVSGFKVEGNNTDESKRQSFNYEQPVLF